MNPTELLVRKLHNLPGSHKVVLAITGGGAEAVGELLRHGNGSATLLEAVIPYDQNAFNAFVKGQPDKYCSPGAARDLAMAAYIRATKLTGNHDVLGVGASCSLKKDGTERAGRQHHVYVAFQNMDMTATYEYEIAHNEFTTREQEETFAAEKIINAVVAGFGFEGLLGFLEDSVLSAKHESNIVMGHPGWKELIRGDTNIHTHVINYPGTPPKYILSGAFNPVHARHVEIAEAVHKLKGERVDFELAVKNVDKPPVNYFDMSHREERLIESLMGKPWAGNIHFTGTPTFVEKAQLFPGATFVVGMDTFVRIGDLKYYDNDERKRFYAHEKLKTLGCRFLVFNRIINGVPTTKKDFLKVSNYLNSMAELIPDDILPPNDMSSSQIRKNS